MMARRHLTAGTAALVLAMALPAAALAQESRASDGSRDPIASLVLVLNLISATHARPATGIVIRATTPGAAPGPAPTVAHVLVPSEFVAAGDEIVVLDGGTDILRHGRPGRTVARSTHAGVALLEVVGLERAGVELSADAWPPVGGAGFEFAAWPSAEALAEGAPLIRGSLRFEDIAGETALPDVSGPLFDRCGRLAALHLAGHEGRLADAGTMADYLRSAGFETVQAPCGEVPAAEVAAAEAQGTPEQASPATLPPDPAKTGTPSAAVGPEGFNFMRWAWAGGLLALAAVAAFLAVRMRRQRPVLQLVGAEAGNRGARLELRLKGGAALLQREGRSLLFEPKGGRVLVSDRGGEAASRLLLAVGATACLPGEVFVVDPGQEIRIAAEAWRLQFDPKVTP